MGCLSGAQAQPPGVGVAWEKFGEGGEIRLRRGNRPSPVSAVFSNETTAILGGGEGRCWKYLSAVLVVISDFPQRSSEIRDGWEVASGYLPCVLAAGF